MTAPARRPLPLRVVGWYPAVWAVGLGAAFWPLVAAVSAGRVWRVRLDGPMAAALAVVGALVLSAGVGAAAGFAGAGRVIGLAANLSVWVGLVGLLAVEREVDAAGRLRFLRTCVVVGSVHSAVALVALVLYPTRLPLPLLGGVADRLPPGIGNFTSRELIDDSWLSGPALRTVGMMAQPTWSGAVAALTILVTLVIARSLSTRGRLLAVAATAANAVNVYCSYSRSTQIALVAVLLFVALRAATRRLRVGPALLVLVVAAVTAVVTVNVARLADEVIAVNDAREGSADARGAIYAASLSWIAKLGVPILGYGLKPQQDGLVASVATHSTYLGLLFRGGILGLVAFLALVAFCAVRCARSRSGVPLAMVLFIAVWCVFEDFDSGHLVPLFLAAAVHAAGSSGPAGQSPPAIAASSAAVSTAGAAPPEIRCMADR